MIKMCIEWEAKLLWQFNLDNTTMKILAKSLIDANGYILRLILT